MKLVVLLLVFVVVHAFTPDHKKLGFNDEIHDLIPEDVNSVDAHGCRTVFDFIVVGAGASGSIIATRYLYILFYFFFTTIPD